MIDIANWWDFSDTKFDYIGKDNSTITLDTPNWEEAGTWLDLVSLVWHQYLHIVQMKRYMIPFVNYSFICLDKDEEKRVTPVILNLLCCVSCCGSTSLDNFYSWTSASNRNCQVLIVYKFWQACMPRSMQYDQYLSMEFFRFDFFQFQYFI